MICSIEQKFCAFYFVLHCSCDGFCSTRFKDSKKFFFLIGPRIGPEVARPMEPNGVGLGIEKKTCLLNGVGLGFGTRPTGWVRT